jgi:phage I-like protein
MTAALATALCARPLAGGAAPEWVHLLPLGAMEGRDGRRFVLSDPGAVVAAFQAARVDLPIDYGHQNDLPPREGGPVPAAGWIKALAVRADGLWGRVEWTARARELIAAREYRYLSPVLAYRPKDGRIVRLKGAGLVHNPNLHLTALAHQEDGMDDQGVMARLAEALGLGADADADAILREVAALLKARDNPDPKRFAPVEALQEALRERNAQLATLGESRARAKVEAAIRDGHITPAMRGWATALCAADEASFDGFLAHSARPYAHLLAASHTRGRPPGEGGGEAAPEGSLAAAVCRQLGLAPGALRD